MIFRMKTQGSSPFGALFIFLFLGLLLLGMVLFFGLMLRLLYFAGPVLLILALILDFRTVTAYIGGLVKLLKMRPVQGIASILLSVVGYPIVAVFLLGRILLQRRFRRYEQEMKLRQEGEIADYVELDSKPLPAASRLAGKGHESDYV